METKHTAGPWAIVGGDRSQLTIVCKPGDGIVTHVARLHDDWICDEHGGTAFANARLIAAAPELLKALERIAAMTCDHGPQEFCPRTLAAETIDKATA